MSDETVTSVAIPEENEPNAETSGALGTHVNPASVSVKAPTSTPNSVSAPPEAFIEFPNLTASGQQGLQWGAALIPLSSMSERSLNTTLLLGGFFFYGAMTNLPSISSSLRSILSEATPRAAGTPAGDFDIYSFCYISPNAKGSATAPSIPHSGPILNLSEHAREALVAARDYAERTANDGEIHARHVIAALLTAKSANGIFSVQQELANRGYSLKEVRRSLLEAIRTEMRGRDQMDAWEDILLDSAAPFQSILLPERVAGYTTDAISEEDESDTQDKLGITYEVNALCSVLMARNVNPPLSIGLFGDWGTGKSFFMSQMQGCVKYIQGVAREAKQVGETTAFCSHVVQIPFNAWHYMDANLWASLMTQIVDHLYKEISVQASEQKDCDPEKMRKMLFSQLKSAQDVLAEKDTQRNNAVQARETAQAKAQNLETARQKKEVNLKEIRSQVWQDVVKDPEIHKQLEAAAKQLGIQEIDVVADQLHELMQSGVSLYNRSAGLKRWLATNPLRILWLLVCLLGSGAIALLIAWALSYVTVRPEFKLLAQYIGGLVSALGSVVLFLKSWRQKAKNALQPLEEARRLVEQKQQQKTEQELALEKEVEQLRVKEAAAQQETQKQNEVVDALEREIDEISAGRRLGKFLEERASSTDYRRHEGIIASIRGDFERLSKLLMEAGKETQAPPAEDQAAKPARSELPCIDRIVLYIDDLDRCPADTVVKVLQAIHLLLAFPLFVVVVGVDSRWMLNALRQHYKEYLGYDQMNGEANGNDRQTAASTPQNYLEKIFQIPYTLNPMDEHSYQGMIKSLVQIDAAKTDKQITTAPSVPGASLGYGPTSGPDYHPGIPTDVRLPVVPPDAPSLPGAAAPLPTRSVPIGRNPDGLFLNMWERDCMGRLAPLMASPRAAKRLVNIYSLLRSFIRQPAQLNQFAGDADALEYQTALILLALQIRFPNHAGSIFSALMKAHPQDDWWVFVAKLGAKLNDPPIDPRRVYNNVIYADLSEEEASAWNELVTRVEAMKSSFPQQMSLLPFQKQVRFVARFSFQTGPVLSQLNSAGKDIQA